MAPQVFPVPAPERRRLDAWKGIAQYLGRDVTTVRRWEKREGLPVHRHLHAKLGSVYAFTDEVDEWWRQRLVRADRGQTEPQAAETARAAVPQVVEAAPAAVSREISRLRPDPRPRRTLWTGVGLALIGLLATTAMLTDGPWLPKARTRSAIRVPLTPPEGLVRESLVISPDGQRVAFAGSRAAGVSLWLQKREESEAQQLPGTDGASFPFWSADNQQLGFFAGGRLKRIDLRTGEIHDLAPAPKGHGGTWNSRGDIVFAPDHGSPLWRLSISGGGARVLTLMGTTIKEGHAWPQFLPDGRRFLYTDTAIDQKRFGIYVGDLETGAVKRVLPVYSSARYANGYLIYSLWSKNALVAQGFDLERLETVGEPFAIAERPLHRSELEQWVDFSVSESGSVVARSAEEERNTLVWIDRPSGRVSGTVGAPGYYYNPVLSPDARTLAVTVTEEPDAHLWIFDALSGKGSRLTTNKWDFAPLFSPDGNRLIFNSARRKNSGVSGIYDRTLATGTEAQVFAERRGQTPESWGRRGRYLTFATVGFQTKWDVWAWNLLTPGPAFPVLSGAAQEGQSQLSPDERFIAYASDESGHFEVYVRAFPTSTETWRVSTGGGADPRWRSDGRELYFLAPDGKMMAVDVTTGATFKQGTPKPLFSTAIEVFWQDTRNHYDVTPDGQTFIVVVPDGSRRYGPYTAITNWQK